MCTNCFHGADLSRPVSSHKFSLHGTAVFLLVFVATLAPDSACYGTDIFGSIAGSLSATAGTNTGTQQVTSLGNFNLSRSQGGESAEINLDTSLLNNNVFQFSMTAETTSATGSTATGINANFQLPFSIAKKMRVFLTAEVVNNPDDFDVIIAQVVINDGNELLSLSVIADTGGTALSDSLVFSPATVGTHRISGSVFTAAQSPGTHIGSVQGTVMITDPSDINGDLSVDGEDLGIWMAGFGTSLASFEQGDMNDDLQVNGADFLQWQRGFGTILGTVAAATVPEPATVMLIAWGLVWGITGRRSRRPY